MKKTVFIALLLCLTALIQLNAQSATERSIIAKLPHGDLVLERMTIPEGLAFNDRISLVQGDESIEVFESEGRAIQQVLHEDLDGDGVAELLIQMDLGGSGAFREFELLQYKDGVYLPVWLDTGYAAGEVSIEDRDGTGRKKVYITYIDTDTDASTEITAVFDFVQGTLQRR